MTGKTSTSILVNALHVAESNTRSRVRHRNTDPLRNVVKGYLRNGRVNIIAGFYGYWHELTLECGHEVQRPGKAKAPPGERMPRGYARQHRGVRESWYLPAPKKVRCERCAAEMRKESAS